MSHWWILLLVQALLQLALLSIQLGLLMPLRGLELHQCVDLHLHGRCALLLVEEHLAPSLELAIAPLLVLGCVMHGRAGPAACTAALAFSTAAAVAASSQG